MREILLPLGGTETTARAVYANTAPAETTGVGAGSRLGERLARLGRLVLANAKRERNDEGAAAVLCALSGAAALTWVAIVT